MILDSKQFHPYIDHFNRNDEETVIQAVDNAHAWDWLKGNMPLFECPDARLEETYYFRWWVYRKHLKSTPDGYILTEFHPEVPWAGKHNSINGSAGHHLMEGRWLAHRSEFLPDYIRFWFRKGGALRSYSCWLADAILQYCRVDGDFTLAVELLPDLVENYHAWEKSHGHSSGLFWSHDDRDAMEFSISGPGLRPTLNSYLAADARAISEIARLSGNRDWEEEFRQKADRLRTLLLEKLWDASAGFFKVLPLESKDAQVTDWSFEKIQADHNVREQIGFIPWYFNLPGPGYETAWSQLTDPEGFSSAFGPTTAEQRHVRFQFRHDEHECLWNGPSWPFATAQTLTALANLMNDSPQEVITREDYFRQLNRYARCHYRVLPDGRTVSWLDENLDAFTGEWLSRRILEDWGWRTEKGGRERGKDYNHSTFCDLVISGLVGIRPCQWDVLEIRPLVPDNTWDYFCLDQVFYHGRKITVMYDKNGTRYGRGTGLQVLVDGVEQSRLQELGRLTVQV